MWCSIHGSSTKERGNANRINRPARTAANRRRCRSDAAQPARALYPAPARPLAAVMGVALGAISGFYGGITDGLLMRFVDLMLAFPSIFLLLVFFSVQGSSSVTWVIVLLGIFGWMWLTRIIRGEFFSLKERDFVEA